MQDEPGAFPPSPSYLSPPDAYSGPPAQADYAPESRVSESAPSDQGASEHPPSRMPDTPFPAAESNSLDRPQFNNLLPRADLPSSRVPGAIPQTPIPQTPIPASLPSPLPTGTMFPNAYEVAPQSPPSPFPMGHQAMAPVSPDISSSQSRPGRRAPENRTISLIIAGALILILGIFGIYLWKDFNKLVPEDLNPAPGTEPAQATATAPAPTPGTVPAPPPASTNTGPATATADPATPPSTLPPEPAPRPEQKPVTKPEVVATNAPSTPETSDASAASKTGTSMPGVYIDPENAPAATGLLDLPIKTLQNFLNAPNWQKRADYSLYPEIVRPLMESYYQSQPDEAVEPISIRFQHSETDPDSKRRFYVFHLITEKAPEGFPVLIEETEKGALKVDWETFVEFKDNLFSAFATTPETGKAGTFHVIMRNAHYFGDSFPELSDLTPYRLDPPIPDQESYAFAKTDSLVNGEMQKHVSWGMNFTPYLELRWAKSQNGTDYLQIVRLLHTNWRNREP